MNGCIHLKGHPPFYQIMPFQIKHMTLFIAINLEHFLTSYGNNCVLHLPLAILSSFCKLLYIVLCSVLSSLELYTLCKMRSLLQTKYPCFCGYVVHEMTNINNLKHDTTNKMNVCKAKTQIHLGIRPLCLKSY